LVPIRIAPEDVAQFVKTAFLSPNVKGLWVTVPHKSAVMRVLDRTDALATIAGAVNAVRRSADGRLEGALFDGEGFCASLDYFNIAYTGKKVLMLGAGGAAAAIGASMVQGARACADIAMFDPTPGKAAETCGHLRAHSNARVYAVANNDPAGYNIVINASPLGLKPTDPMPCDVARMDAGAALVDILMKNQPTPVVRAARARGLVAQPGFEMMILQTAHYLQFFGMHDAAQYVRMDANFIRELIYPSELLGEIRRPASAQMPAPLKLAA
jgi:shikimate dehydrogenase